MKRAEIPGLRSGNEGQEGWREIAKSRDREEDGLRTDALQCARELSPRAGTGMYRRRDVESSELGRATHYGCPFGRGPADFEKCSQHPAPP